MKNSFFSLKLLFISFFCFSQFLFAVPVDDYKNVDQVSKTEESQEINQVDTGLSQEIKALIQRIDELIKRILKILAPQLPIPPSIAQPQYPGAGMSSSVYPGLKIGATAYVHVPSRLNFRDSPWGSIKGKLPPGKEVKVIGFSGNWVKISVDGKEGFVHGKYLKPQQLSTKSGPDQLNPSIHHAEPTGPSSFKPPAGIAKKILDEAKNQLGTTRYQSKITDWGNLACAAFVSGVLKDSGAINHSGSLNTKGLASKLENDGWKDVGINNIQPGDVIFWGPYPGRKHGHVGIIDGKYGGTWYTIDNSSTQRVPIKRPLNYKRPILKVLRAPGA
ncbi:SH3 domain-containing protein [Candidatus Riflebacteria bacterium]